MEGEQTLKWIIPALMVLLLGVITVAVLYGTEESAPAQQPGSVEIDIDRSKPRPPLKQQPAKPAPKKVK